MNHGQVLVKVYGNVWPAGMPLLEALRPLFAALPCGELSSEETLVLDGDLVRLSYEGVYFPLEEALEIISAHLGPDSQGKVDYLDMDAWTLQRSRIVRGRLETSSASLNAVLDYSGH